MNECRWFQFYRVQNLSFGEYLMFLAAKNARARFRVRFPDAASNTNKLRINRKISEPI